MLASQHLQTANPVQAYPFLDYSALQFHLQSIAAAVRLSLALFSLPQTEHQSLPQPLTRTSPLNLVTNPQEKKPYSEKAKLIKFEAGKLKDYKNGNSFNSKEKD
jgi:hypothetical protein